MLTRRSVWSNKAIQELSRQFIPVAEDSERLEGESAFFRKFVSQGHFGAHGMAAPKGVWQGTYVVTPGGDLLGSTLSPEARDVEKLLRDALARWQAHPEAPLRAEALPASRTMAARSAAYPRDGLVLRIFGRDLEQLPAGPVYTRVGWWNLDFAWFHKEEAARFVPSPLHVGAEVEVPQALVARLARLHLLDMVNGVNSGVHYGGLQPTYLEREVERARLVARVDSIEDNVIRLHLEGETRAVTHRIAPERGLSTKLLGRATWDTKLGRFTSFELAALGERWGPTGKGRFDDRAKQPGHTAIGYFLELAPDDAADRISPIFLSDYGWK